MRFSVFQAGRASRRMRERIGEYGEAFVRLLAEPGQHWDVHDVQEGEFPADLGRYDGVVVTGSPASVYDDLPWVHELLAQVAEIHRRGIPLLGICFGAQAVAQALGGEVQPNPLGWELGLVGITLTDQGRALPSLAGAPQPLRVLQTHRDIVTRLPAQALHVATSRRTPYEAFTVGETVLCLQGHPELDNASVQELIEKRTERGLIDPERAREGLASLSAEPHRAFLEPWLRAFLREGRLRLAA